jgi:hypothetical protein
MNPELVRVRVRVLNSSWDVSFVIAGHQKCILAPYW